MYVCMYVSMWQRPLRLPRKTVKCAIFMRFVGNILIVGATEICRSGLSRCLEGTVFLAVQFFIYKLFGLNETPEFNIFNIAVERCIFWRKCVVSFRGNVEYVEFWDSLLNQNVLMTAKTREVGIRDQGFKCAIMCRIILNPYTPHPPSP